MLIVFKCASILRLQTKAQSNPEYCEPHTRARITSNSNIYVRVPRIRLCSGEIYGSHGGGDDRVVVVPISDDV